MAIEHEKLRATLEQLQAQLEEVRKLDPTIAAHLDATIAEARAALAGKPTPPAAQGSIVDRLSDSVLKLEVSHPSVAASLGNLIDALAQLGI